MGYFLMWQGINDVGSALIAFDTLVEYEAYQACIRQDPRGRDNFAMTQTKRFIQCEERSFVEVVDGTFGIPTAKP